MANLQRLPAKIDYLLLLPQHLQLCVMQLANLPNFISAKAINAYALQLQNVYQDYEIQFQLALR
jgi:hypothetical protein